MSVSSVGSSNYLQWPFQADSAGGSSDTSPTDALQSLYQALTGGNSSDPLIAALGQDTGSGGSNSSSGTSGVPQFSADMMSTLLALQSGQNSAASGIAQDVIAKFDTNGDGQISQSEFESAIGSSADQSGVDALFSKLDSNGDGEISQDELTSAMQKAHEGGGGHHHHHHVESSSNDSQQQGGGTDPLQALLSGASADGTTSQSSSNADGSTTTTITYSDGTKLEMTTPAASSDSGNSSGSSAGSGNPNSFNLGNLLKMIVNLQAQYASPTTNVSV